MAIVLVDYSGPTPWSWFGYNPPTNPDVQEAMEWEWRMRWLKRTVVELGRLYDVTFRPLLLVFKRFDFRASPRWRSQRWKAKT